MLDRAVPAARPADLTTFTIKVDGEELPGTYRVVSIDIARAINRIATTSLVLYDGDPAAQDFPLSSGAFLVPGQAIEIEGGYAGDESLLFKGVITRQKIKAKRKGESLLFVECKDAFYRLTLARKSCYFKDISDSEVFESIVAEYGDLGIEVEATGGPRPDIVQYQVSDWDFIVSRAEALGLVCITEDGILKVTKPDLSQEPMASVAYGTGIYDLEMEMDGRLQTETVTAASWDMVNQEVLSSELTEIEAPAQGNIDGSTLAQEVGAENIELQHGGVLSQQELDTWAEAQLRKSRLAKIRGTVRFQGNGDVKTGTLIDLGGLGERFNGTAYVSGVRHALGGGDWETSIQVGFDPNWHYQNFPINAAPAAGFYPAINGLQIGVVTQLQDDPAGEDRILVRLPVINPEAEGIWTRIATLDAGENRGTVFRPEIGDEVIVGFVNDDPNQAVILGMLHSSAKPAPLATSDDNHEKGLVTRSEMKVIFNDDEVSLTIETPKGNRIVLSEKEGAVTVTDENRNTIILDSNGIALESPADVVVKATGDVRIEGMNVQIKASANLSAEGSAGAELKSGGNTVVKGSLVQIN
ncbi:MAG: type VI secretion system tip protein VgrG [Deltaproteobacteria bacterium]|nr:type VI secretion system tip protein VgrG [Deltaproteobacteria bacterium]